MKEIRILRLTRHEAGEEQVAELRRIFGDNSIIVETSETLPNNTREAVARFDAIAAEAEVVEAVLPVNLLESILKFSNFTKNGGTLIRVQGMKRIVSEDGSATFIFEPDESFYEVVRSVEIVTERL